MESPRCIIDTIPELYLRRELGFRESETIVIKRIKLLRNIGQFDSVSPGTGVNFATTTLIYAENGRGKTTLAAVWRSLRSGDAGPITERKRLAATHSPHAVLETTNSGPLVFQNGAWSAPFPDIAVFDDIFVAENVCSGVEIDAEHRQNLHELIVGVQGVSLNAVLQKHIDKIEEHNRNLKAKGDGIPPAARGAMAVDDFCALKAVPEIDTQIRGAERTLAAAKSAEAIRKRPTFAVLALPRFDTAGIEALLQRGLKDLDAAAAARVQSHLETLGPGAESWVGDGMSRIVSAAANSGCEICPFCAQDLRPSPIIEHYRAYFSDAYSSLKQDIENAIHAVNADHGDNAPAAFEREIRVAVENREFWKDFTDVAAISLDTAAIVRAWEKARETVLALLAAKKAAPLDAVSQPPSASEAITAYDTRRGEVDLISKTLQGVNTKIALIKELAASANVATLTADLAKLKAVKERHTPEIASRCQAYLDEKSQKRITEGLRKQAREALETYRTSVFPAYEVLINDYLTKFNAGFRLQSVTSVNTRSGSSCNYSVLINNVPVSITGGTVGPSFRNTLSSGDRNALALAFFFASLDQDQGLAQKVVVIDDPMTSLDDHRSVTTVQEVRRLAGRVKQVIVLSHSKAFLCGLWQGLDTAARSALKIARDGLGSAITEWNVNNDCVTEHDRRYAQVKAYIRGNKGSDERAVAAALRPILESFARVAYPDVFPPGSMLGPFIEKCQQRLGTSEAVLGETDIVELRDLLDYANRFHHDTNTAWKAENINDQELLGFCRRTLAFASKNGARSIGVGANT